MVSLFTKELLICYVNGTKDQFLDIEFNVSVNLNGDEKSIILNDKKNRVVYIQLNNVLKYYIKKNENGRKK